MDDDDDPLWLNSPVKRRAFRLACYAVPVLLGALMGRVASGSHWGALATATGVVCMLLVVRDALPRALARLGGGLRARALRQREGVHHSFAGVDLDLHDDGRQVWLHETGVRRLLGLRDDPPDAFRARFSRHWRTAAELGLRGKGLWLDAADVHRYLGSAPERMDPRRLKLRTYLDREILQPAARRRGR